MLIKTEKLFNNSRDVVGSSSAADKLQRGGTTLNTKAEGGSDAYDELTTAQCCVLGSGELLMAKWG